MPCKACHKPKSKPYLRVKLAQGKRYIWMYRNEEYILAQVASGEYALISLENGNRWHDPESLESLQECIDARKCFKAVN